MHKIYNDTNELQYIIYYASELKDGRYDIVPDDKMLQVSISKHKKDHHPKAHKHLFKDLPKSAITTECWIVFRGKIRIELYKDHNTIIQEAVLSEGDILVTLFGGHTYKVLEENTIVYEIKLGPFYGTKKDKDFIKDDHMDKK